MIREKLSSFLRNEQSVMSDEWSCSPLRKENEMAYGTIQQKDRLHHFALTNRKLLEHRRWCEFMRIMAQMEVEFTNPDEVRRLFLQAGIDTREGNILEMYMEDDDLLCTYSFQVDLDYNSPLFMSVHAYVK